MNVYVWNRLPSTYQEVEYIQSSWTQYIDTWYKPNNNTEVSAKFSLVSLNNSYVYWVRNDQSGSSRRAFFMWYDTSLQKFYAQVLNNTDNNQILSLSNASLDTIYTTLQNNISFYINWELQWNYNNQSAFSVWYNMFVFWWKIGDSVGNKMPMKLYYMKISESWALVRDFVPCYRKSDNVIWLYDLVNNQFYTNSWTGTFSKGNDVTMAVLKNAYIGEYTVPYLCFTANTASSTVQLTQTWTPTSVTLETSTDGTNWTTYTIWDTITLSNIWDKVFFRNTSTTDTWFSTSGSNYYKFVMTWSISGSWDTNYLLNKNSTTTVSSYCYYQLFRDCTSLTTAPNLPATTLSQYCYSYIFRWCTWLTTAPSTLPATTLAKYCYYFMFRNCTSLTAAPELPATTLADSCYYYMFSNCTSLTTTPELPATTLVDSCYYYMFNYCTSLTTATELPATTLASSCYYGMFFRCSNLEEFPKLPATTLATECYAYMFNWCSKIKISTTQTWEYQIAYRIPTTWTGTTWTNSLNSMFSSTWWTFTWTPSINTTYYTSNTVV